MDDADVANEATVTKMNQLFDDAFHSLCEGLMVKSLDIEAGYLPSKHSDSWLKVLFYTNVFNESAVTDIFMLKYHTIYRSSEIMWKV